MVMPAAPRPPARPQEHETALRYFQRALQLDPTLPYAYTLAGHEYFANEDFEKGVTCYRNAIRIDPRHYNAWCAGVVVVAGGWWRVWLGRRGPDLHLTNSHCFPVLA
jgi:tetratricopeptide (TPR) repeat protein